ncbi:alpha/beta fold hydrolase [Actinomadura sp. LOL_016]|uniref:alpha/beta fold hydrolase n=1 Tax=unclassified Actinomadura TaxID=2626254 RepID=UPI003A810D77
MDEYQSIWLALREVEFTQRFLDVQGVRTRVVTAGSPDKPALVMLHGTGGHWEAFSRVLGPLSEHFHCIAYDMVGNGFSAKPDHPYEISVYIDHLLGVLGHFDIEKASLIGSSLGSWVAARFALEHPERTDRIVLNSPAGLIANAQNMARIKRQRTAAVEGGTWESMSAIFDHLIADEHNRIADLIALRLAVYRRPDTKATVRHLLALQEAGVRERNLITEDQWRGIRAPALVVASGKDHADYTTTARRVLELLPHGEALEMPSVGHWAAFEDPDAFVARAIPFLQGK